MRVGFPFAISELMETMALEERNMVPDTKKDNFVEEELLLHVKVPPEKKGMVLNYFRDQIGVRMVNPLPTVLGVGSLKAKEPKTAHGVYLFASWSTQLPLSR